jgi:hypothetical protein
MEAGRKVGREGQEGGLSLLSLRTRRPSAGAADMGGLWLAQGPSSPLALLDRWGEPLVVYQQLAAGHAYVSRLDAVVVVVEACLGLRALRPRPPLGIDTASSSNGNRSSRPS